MAYYDPAKQKYVTEPPKPKKARTCPICKSDRESTKKLIPLSTVDGTPAGTGPCPDDWHNTEKADGRIGSGSRSVDANRSNPTTGITPFQRKN